MRSCLRTHVLLSASNSPDALPQLAAAPWTSAGWAGWTSGHTNGPKSESTIHSSVKSTKTREHTREFREPRGSLTGSGISEGTLGAGQTALPSRLEKDN